MEFWNLKKIVFCIDGRGTNFKIPYFFNGEFRKNFKYVIGICSSEGFKVKKIRFWSRTGILPDWNYCKIVSGQSGQFFFISFDVWEPVSRLEEVISKICCCGFVLILFYDVSIKTGKILVFMLFYSWNKKVSEFSPHPVERWGDNFRWFANRSTCSVLT
jgi:hypothetical protein